MILHSQLLLMKRGGRVIYGGKIGKQSDVMIKYFQVTLSSIISYIFSHSIPTFILLSLLFLKVLNSIPICSAVP